MTRNLKALGLALIAVFALSATAASTASAVDTFIGPAATFPVTATNVSGGVHNINKFEITAPATKVECTTAHFAGTGTNGSNHLTLTPTYSGTLNVKPHTTDCSSSVGTADIDMNGCTYTLTGNTTGVDNGTDATVSIVCPAGKEITLTLTKGGLTLHIHAQTPTTGGVTYTNNVPVAGQVTVHATATGITYSCVPSFICTLADIPAEGNNIDYTGTVVASSTAGPISVSGS